MKNRSTNFHAEFSFERIEWNLCKNCNILIQVERGKITQLFSEYKKET